MSDDIDVQVAQDAVEKEARTQNWVPKEEFRGKEDDWIDAETFVQRGRQINHILRANNERIKAELAKTQLEMVELRKSAEEFRLFQKESFEKKSAALDTEIKALREDKAKAISAGDGSLVSEIEDRIDAIKEEKATAKVEVKAPAQEQNDTSAPLDPVLVAWIDKNDWYKNSITMKKAANSIADVLHEDEPDLSGQAFLDKLDEQLAEAFPSKLGKTPKPRSPVEGASGSGVRNAKEHSYEKLPSDAKAACDKFVKQKLMTREQYVSDYQWS
jgi:hypothetical protein